MEKEHINRLRNAGCAIMQFNTPHWYSLEEVNYRTHRKILVIDGDIAFTGGAGVADHWLGHAQDPEHWRDTQVRATGPIARLLEGSFYENVIEGGTPVAPLLDEPKPPANDESPTIVVSSSPSGGSSDLKRLYLVLIASAKKTLDITTPYFVTDESSMWVLDDAVKRGVKVRILVEGDETDAMPVKYASRQTYDQLLTMGIAIHEYQPTMMHAKSLVVDGVISMFGSANFDNRSLELNDEVNIAVWGRDLAARFESDFEADLHRAARLNLDDWRNRPRLERTREFFWSYFSEVF